MEGENLCSVLKLLKISFLPFSLFCFIATMALLPNPQALDVYVALFDIFSIEPQWVSVHSTTISNVGHVLGFFSLAIICRISTPLRFCQIALLCIALAGSIELTQKLLSYRQGRWDDLVLGVTGSLMGTWGVSVWESIRRGTMENESSNTS